MTATPPSTGSWNASPTSRLRPGPPRGRSASQPRPHCCQSSMPAQSGAGLRHPVRHADAMDLCPSCGENLAARPLRQTLPGEHARHHRSHVRELRRCPSCRRLAWRDAGTNGPWNDAGTDPSIDHLFDREPRTLPEPWVVVPAPETRAALERQLRVEVSEGHPLFGKALTAVARCSVCDEVLFSVDEDPAWFAQVHLTWRQAPETPPWPWAERLTMPLADSLTDHSH